MDNSQKPNNVNWKSDFSMGQYDFQIYFELKKYLAALAQKVSMYDIESLESLQEYWATLRALYMFLAPICYEDQNKKLKEDFEKALTEIANSKKASSQVKVSIKAHKMLLELNEQLFTIMQYKGLGITVSKELSEKQKLDRSFRTVKDRTPDTVGSGE